MKKIFMLFCLSTLTVSVVSAQRLLTEDFNYATGPLTTVIGGSWVHFSGETNNVQVIAGNLTYPGYVTDPSPTSGRVMLDSVEGNGEDAFIKFTRTNSGTVYYS